MVGNVDNGGGSAYVEESDIDGKSLTFLKFAVNLKLL